MKIRIIQVGKTKDVYLQEGVEEFMKRLGPFVALEIVDLKEVSPSKTFSEEKCKEAEGESILKALGSEDFVVALDERGKHLDSAGFGELLGKYKDSGQTVSFVIGGAFGLVEAVKARADLILSLSHMTFTHQMIRLFLLEQIYRGICIIYGKRYHND